MNKHDFITQLINEYGATPDDYPAALFMAGLPGSGKTEISRNLIIDSGVHLLRIDMDGIAEMLPNYQPEKTDEFRKPATKLLNECFTYALHHNLSFIMDGTFGSPMADKNIERSLNRNFSVKVIYAFQDPRIAWEFTLAREKIEHRAIKFDGFIESYYKTINNIKNIGDKYSDKITIDIALKTPDNKIGGWLRNVKADQIDNLLNIEYNKDKLINYILGTDHGTKTNSN